MASTDWTELTDDLSAAAVDRGVTSGATPPNGGSSFVYGFNSLVVATGAAGLFINAVNFAPTPDGKGGSIRAAVKRGPGGGSTNFAPMLFIGLQGTSVNDAGYILGLEDNEPNRIALRKAPLVEGLPSSGAGLDGYLGVSTETFDQDTWHHLRLDMIVNANDDVILKAYSSDLVANLVTAPVWEAIPGLADFTDDALGINSGDAGVDPSIVQPFTTGRMGFGFQTQDVTRRGFFDHVEALRQV